MIHQITIISTLSDHESEKFLHNSYIAHRLVLTLTMTKYQYIL